MKTLAVFIVVLLYSVTLSSQERITLLFVGDLMQHQAQIDAAHVSEGKYDYSSCFSLIKEQISQADLAIGNLEVTLGGRPYRGYPMFSAPDEYLQWMQRWRRMPQIPSVCRSWQQNGNRRKQIWNIRWSVGNIWKNLRKRFTRKADEPAGFYVRVKCSGNVVTGVI